MFVSALAQYQSRTDNISLNARFRWEYVVGSELFIVVTTNGRTTLNEGFPTVENASFVVKVTRLMRCSSDASDACHVREAEHAAFT